MRSLAFKVTLACLAASLLGIAAVAGFAIINTSREFSSFVFDDRREDLQTYLAAYFAEHGAWEGALPFPPPPDTEPPDSRFGRGGLTLVDAEGRVVFAGEGHTVGQQLSAAELAAGQPIKVDGVLVGSLIPLPGAPGFGGPAGIAFLSRLNRSLVWGSLSAAGAALLIGVLLARAITRPVKALTQASHRIAQGSLQQHVNIKSADEIGELADAFNRMSTDLAHASQLRRQMTADIAHDLRTPLSMILAHTEALRDGVLPPSLETYTLLHDETLRLSRLVEDLRTLSLADSGELRLARRPTSPGELLARAVAAQSVRAQQQGVRLAAGADPDLPLMDADPDRLEQVLGNLLDNALRCTPSGGSVMCRVTAGEWRTSGDDKPWTTDDGRPTSRPEGARSGQKAEGGIWYAAGTPPAGNKACNTLAPESNDETQPKSHPPYHHDPRGAAGRSLPDGSHSPRASLIRFSIQDSGPGIAPADLPHVFERFYRADKSRQRDDGGSGLGLAIARSLVEAHGGHIWAESRPGQGAQFFVDMPEASAAPSVHRA